MDMLGFSRNRHDCATQVPNHPAKHQFVQRKERVPIGMPPQSHGIKDCRLPERHAAGGGLHVEFKSRPPGQFHFCRQPQVSRRLD